METTYKFKEGQRVKMRDADDGSIVHGQVIDTTRDVVFIKWDDLTDPCEHRRDEFHLITLVNS